MSRRRRRIPRKRSNRWLLAVQVLFMVVVLVFIVMFRDFIAEGAGDVFGAFGSGDVEVTAPEETAPERDGGSAESDESDESTEANRPDEADEAEKPVLDVD